MAVDEAGRRPLQAGMSVGIPAAQPTIPGEDRTTKDMPRQRIHHGGRPRSNRLELTVSGPGG